MTIARGSSFPLQNPFIVSFRPSLRILTGTSSSSTGAVARISGEQPAVYTALTTSRSIIYAKASRSSSVSIQESRVFGCMGLYGMTTGIRIYETNVTIRNGKRDRHMPAGSKPP